MFLVTLIFFFFSLFFFSLTFFIFIYTISSNPSSLISFSVKTSPRYLLTLSKSIDPISTLEFSYISLTVLALGSGIVFGYHLSMSIDPMITLECSFTLFTFKFSLLELYSSIFAIVSSVDLETWPTSNSFAIAFTIMLPKLLRPMFVPTFN